MLFYTDRARTPAKDEAGQPLKDKDGKAVYEEYRRSHPVVRQYTVFNAEQADGLNLPKREAQAPPEWKAHADAEVVIGGSGVRISHVAGDRAFYNLPNDQVVLPEQGQFATANGYYQTALHELGHGHRPRKPLEPENAARGHSRGLRERSLRARRAAGGDQRHDDGPTE